ncbi:MULTISPECIES: hypothetical protein [unclassified Streptomyces]|uniref:hypothetical protein n=1 Tax=unclassified Streptomyces TaxID=2593676 RepID=UPI0011613472|nr:hypothetical protein [Streptomyces sp. TSRI0281]
MSREVREGTLQAITAIAQNLGLPLTHSAEQVAAARRELQGKLNAIHERRRTLTAEIQGITEGNTPAGAPAGYDSSLTVAYGDVTSQLRRATEEMADLEHLLEEHRRSARTVTAEVGRMENV